MCDGTAIEPPQSVLAQVLVPTTATDAPQEQQHNAGPCCWYIKYGVCEPPRPPCRFDHSRHDDGVTPCCFGAACRLGHAKRVVQLVGATYEDRVAYWSQQGNYCTATDKPAQRPAASLQSQLEPYSTAVLRDRLVYMTINNNNVNNNNARNSFVAGDCWDGAPRSKIMEHLLHAYQPLLPRKRIQIRAPLQNYVGQRVLFELQAELVKWRNLHNFNTRPSIHAQAYMILRNDLGIGSTIDDDSNANCGTIENAEQQQSNHQPTLSRKARQAQKKLHQFSNLYNLAKDALHQVDPKFAATFSALAVTYNFRGSPHIDKQNTGPFYGMSLGTFTGGGGICVEASYDTIAVCSTLNCFQKVDGRFPHWVDDYEGDRYSLIYYSTSQNYQPPTIAYFGDVVDEER